MPRGWFVLALLGASPAHAAPCVPVVHGEELAADWQRAVDAVDHELATRLDIERCIDVVVRSDGARTSVVVAMGDRRATRTVAEPADLRATVLALVLAPNPSPTVTVPPPIEDSGSSVRVIQPRAIERTIDGPPIPSRIGAGIAIGALWTDHDAHPAVALRLGWARGTWSLALAGRFAPPAMASRASAAITTAMPPPAYALLSRDLGVELGHRFARGPVAVTASGGPSLVVLEQRQLAGEPTSRSRTLVRVGAQLRAETVSSRRLGLFVIVDASWDAGQVGQSGDAMPGAPPLPGWSTGIALGGELHVWP